MSLKKSGTTTIDDIVNSNSTDRLQVFIMSWNMGNAPPTGLEYVFREKNATNDFDILVLGLQESTWAATDCIKVLGEKVQEIVGERYFLAKHAYRAQMQLYVFAKKSIQSRISNVEFSVENTGFLHLFPNKGGILVTLQVDGTKLAFISCHLAAHEGVKHCEQRNASIAEIFGGVRAGDDRFDVSEQFHHVFWMGDMNYRTTFDTVNIPSSTKKNVKELNAAAKVKEAEQAKAGPTTKAAATSKSTGESDSESDSEDVGGKGGDKEKKKKEWKEQHRRTMEMVVGEKWSDILSFDELNREIGAERVLNGFTALQPSFPPTFKRSRNLVILPTHNNGKGKKWDTVSDAGGADPARVVSAFYHHKRIPSFTDRILHKSQPTFRGNLRNYFFESCEQAVSSDHKPVRAGFEIKLTRAERDIVVDKQLLNWKGKPSKKTSGKRGDVSLLHMTLSDMKGKNLEEMDSSLFGGGSDPYVVVSTDPASALLYKGTLLHGHEGIKSSTISHNLDPVWPDVLDLKFPSMDLKGLSRNVSVIISVWDWDRSNSDDLIGMISVPLKDILVAHSQNKPYILNEAPLYSNTEITGRFSGKIQVQGSFKDLMSNYEKFEAERLKSPDQFYTLADAQQGARTAPNAKAGCIMS